MNLNEICLLQFLINPLGSVAEDLEPLLKSKLYAKGSLNKIKSKQK